MISFKHLKKERIGTIRKNRYGSTMKVVEYYSNSDIWIRFIEHRRLVNTTWQNFINGKVKSPYDKSVLGIGYLGEGEYKTKDCELHTPQYHTWRSMLQRCYDEKYQEKQPTYKGCSVCPEWHNFQTFAKWYDENYYEIEGHSMAIDKDILVKGNKLYSPDTCVFVPNNINQLFIKQESQRGELPIGVCWDSSQNKYYSQCSNGKGKTVPLGFFNDSNEAFFIYKTYKEKLIKQIAKKYKNAIPKKLYRVMMKYQVEITD